MRSDKILIDKDLLLDVYERGGRSLNQTALLLGVSSKTIKRRFDEYGIIYDPKTHYSCNEEYFDTLTEQSVYWLGFLITDGNVRKHNYSYTIKLALATEDVEHIKKLKQHIAFTGPVHSYIIKNNGKQAFLKKEEYYSSTMSITSKKIFDRLAQFNVIPAKTHIVSFPEQIKNNPLLPHFIRGCIDGDGWIRLHNNNGSEKPTEVRIGMSGTKRFVNETFNVIRSSLNIESGSCHKKKEGKDNWNFEFTALNDVDKIVDWLYKDATILLERKHEIAKFAKGFAARFTLPLLSKNELEQAYIEYKSIEAVARVLGHDPQTIKNKLVEFNIPHKSRSK